MMWRAVSARPCAEAKATAAAAVKPRRGAGALSIRAADRDVSAAAGRDVDNDNGGSLNAQLVPETTKNNDVYGGPARLKVGASRARAFPSLFAHSAPVHRCHRRCPACCRRPGLTVFA